MSEGRGVEAGERGMQNSWDRNIPEGVSVIEKRAKGQSRVRQEERTKWVKIGNRKNSSRGIL